MTRKASIHWPQVFLPEKYCRPPAVEPRRNERVLHICLRVPGDPQQALANALHDLSVDGGAYVEVDWNEEQSSGKDVAAVACEKARGLNPTLVFAQIQTRGVLTSVGVNAIRALCAPNAVIVQWDGDQHYEPKDEQRMWFRELGSACDVSLICNTQYPLDYDKMNVRCGYLNIGVDDMLWRPTAPDPKAPDIVLLASNYAHLQKYSRRVAAARMLSYRFPTAFAAYGYGWEQDPLVKGRPFVKHEAEAPIYSKALAALSISIRNDLPRYTSDRLFRCLAAGALTLVEEFPDMEGLGLVDGENCVTWRDLDSLQNIVGDILERPTDSLWSCIRTMARKLSASHTWDARMHELAAIVEQLRSER